MPSTPNPDQPHDETDRYDPLTRLRSFRVRADRGKGVGDDCDRLLRSLERVSRDETLIRTAWDTAAPDDLQALAGIKTLKSGKLEIAVSNAGARHRVDRWLRSGGLDLLRDLGKVRIKSVVLLIVNKEHPPRRPKR